MKRFIQNVKTFFLNYEILWKEFSIKLNSLTNKRLTEELLEKDLNALKNQYLISYKSKLQDYKEVKNFCDEIAKRQINDNNWIINSEFAKNK